MMYRSTQEQEQVVAPAHSFNSAFAIASALLFAQVDVVRRLASAMHSQVQFDLFSPPQLSRGTVSRMHTSRIFPIFVVFMIASCLGFGLPQPQGHIFTVVNSSQQKSSHGTGPAAGPGRSGLCSGSSGEVRDRTLQMRTRVPEKSV
jgi:hypothetical protein